MFNQLGIIGCGLMGGSFALALKRGGLVKRVIGYSKSPSTTERARKMGVIDVAAESALLAVSGSDIVLLAVPVAATEATLSSLLPSLEAQSLVMDVGSTKQDVAQAAGQAMGECVGQFVPAHPICGKERAGIDCADAGLYQGQQVILTPLEANSPATIAQARAVWEALGCHVRNMPADLHDQSLAAVSHFPHLLAFAFMDSLMAQPEGEQYLALGGPGFRDTTRIAASDPELWTDVLLANATQVIAQAKWFETSLFKIQGLLASQDREGLRAFITQASQRRAQWQLGAQAPDATAPSSD